MGIKLTDDRVSGDTPPKPSSEGLTGSALAVWRLDDFVRDIQNQKLCDTSRVIDFLLDMRNDLTIRA